ncbi:MAG: hypothetical protein O7H39_08605 [Gammaproteobacteria bacterium]|nr:hypothetical protein [Gammaproteobacteria bacterium]
MKEFLAAREVAFESIDVVREPAALETLREAGLRGVPVVARGETFVYAQDLSQVADLVGLEYAAEPTLSPEILVERYTKVLRAAKRFAVQIPAARLADQLPERPRTYLALLNHLVEIAAVYIRVSQGEPFTGKFARAVPSPERGIDGLLQHTDEVIGALQGALQVTQRDPGRKVDTYYGPQSLHALLERCTWHSAQHARQVMMVLRMLDIEPDGALVDEDFDDLPMPNDVWD